jgi:hypothetical protein
MNERTRPPGVRDALDAVGRNRDGVVELVGHIRARVLGGVRGERAVFERVGTLTPYVVETIVEDVLHAGRGARLEVTLRPNAGPDEVAGVQRRFATLVRKGVPVSVRREPGRADEERWLPPPAA